MDTGLQGRSVLITGAGRNIGRETALAFAREGAKLALCTRDSVDRLEDTASAARSVGAEVVTGRCDVSDEASVRTFVDQATEAFGGVDVAVNNAVRRNEFSLLEQTLEHWHKNIAVNLTGPFLICKAVVPGMVERGFGRIVNYSGIAPFEGTGPAKSMAKLGIVGFTRGLATEVAAHGITANCIGPGMIDVERDPWQHEKTLKPSQPVRRLGRPEEIASLAVYLASEQAGFITGQCYLANGGRYYL